MKNTSLHLLNNLESSTKFHSWKYLINFETDMLFSLNIKNSFEKVAGYVESAGYTG